MSSKLSIETILSESEREVGKFTWEGTLADYLRVVIQKPSLSRLSHSLIYDAIIAEGVDTSPEGEPTYRIFDDEMFGLDADLDRLVQYFAASAHRFEVRKRILLLIGPPASGKSSVVELIKRALERYTRTDEGAVYAIRGCPMQEEPLHLISETSRADLMDQYGIYVEGELCPHCRYVLTTEYKGKVAEMPVHRVVFSEREAVGIGHYIATNPNPEAALLVGSVDESKLDGDRYEVAGRAFRLDGELNIANRGLIEFVEMFKADRRLLTALLGLAQEQVIKNQRFGSVYADEAIVGHSNEGDFDTFVSEVTSEALRDRMIALQIPYNLKVTEEVGIYQKLMKASRLQQEVHIAPLTLRVASVFSVLSRLEPSSRQGMSLMDKLHLYDGETVGSYTKQDVKEMRLHHTEEGMSGISPRYVMNRLGAVASRPDVNCLLPLAAMDSLWQGQRENVSLDEADAARYVGLVAESVKEYNALAIKEIQRAFDESFEQISADLLDGYLAGVEAYCTGGLEQGRVDESAATVSEQDMREMERAIGVAERDKKELRHEIFRTVSMWRRKGLTFTYASEPRLRAAIETRLFPPRRRLERGLAQPRFAKQRAEWAQRRIAIANRLVELYGYCSYCSEDLVNYVSHILRNRPVLKTPKNEGVEWLWPLNPTSPDTSLALR